LVVCRRFLARRDIDGTKSARNGRDWLHAGTHAQDLPRTHSAFNSTGTIAEALESIALHNFIVSGASGTAGGFETVSDLDPLDCLNSHECGREPRIQSAIPMNEGAEPGWQAVHQHLDGTSESVSVLVRAVYRSDHSHGCRFIEATKQIGVQAFDV
jgi:hypothetical protein